LMQFQDVSRSSADLVETIKRLPVCWWVLLAGQLWLIWPNPANVNDVQFLLIIFWQCWPLPRNKMWHQIKLATKKHRSVACLKIRHTRSRRGITVLPLQGLRQDRCCAELWKDLLTMRNSYYATPPFPRSTCNWENYVQSSLSTNLDFPGCTILSPVWSKNLKRTKHQLLENHKTLESLCFLYIVVFQCI
jgi:hypothetical protein